MGSWMILALLASLMTVALAAGPVPAQGEAGQPHNQHHGQHNAQHHGPEHGEEEGPSLGQKAKLREKQREFRQKAEAIKNDDSLSQEEKEKRLNHLREHAMLFMGPHALLPMALMQKSPVPEFEEKRKQLIKQVEHISSADIDPEEKKTRLHAAREHFMREVHDIHREMPEDRVAKMKATHRKQTQAEAYKEMIREGIRGPAAAGPMDSARQAAIAKGIRKVTEGLRASMSGGNGRNMPGKMQQRRQQHETRGGRPVKRSLSRPDE